MNKKYLVSPAGRPAGKKHERNISRSNTILFVTTKLTVFPNENGMFKDEKLELV